MLLRRLLTTVAATGIIVASFVAGATAADAAQPSADRSSGQSFDWNWTYDDPTCEALVVTYPSDLPAGQANDVNIRFETAAGQRTLNYHLGEGTWSGRTVFGYAAHPRWTAPAEFVVTWVQVAGTNYHWQGRVACGAGQVTEPDEPTTEPDEPTDEPDEPTDETGDETGEDDSREDDEDGDDDSRGDDEDGDDDSRDDDEDDDDSRDDDEDDDDSRDDDEDDDDKRGKNPAGSSAVRQDTSLVTGYTGGSTTVSKRQRVSSDLINVDGLVGKLELQRLKKGAWKKISTVTRKDGAAVVNYPKQRKKGITRYRLAANGFTSDVLTVKVR